MEDGAFLPGEGEVRGMNQGGRERKGEVAMSPGRYLEAQETHGTTKTAPALTANLESALPLLLAQTDASSSAWDFGNRYVGTMAHPLPDS